MTADDNIPTWFKLLTVVLALAGAVLLSIATVLAFFEGIGFGLIWLFIIDPIAATVLYWVGMLILSPFMAIAGVQAARRERRQS